ncbi:MAG: hypothetical protein R2784_21465 [Saprospiraceae bacterium]
MAKIVNSNAAGIDISSNEHVVAVPEESAKVNVRAFQGFTEDLHDLATLSAKIFIKSIHTI